MGAILFPSRNNSINFFISQRNKVTNKFNYIMVITSYLIVGGAGEKAEYERWRKRKSPTY